MLATSCIYKNLDRQSLNEFQQRCIYSCLSVSLLFFTSGFDNVAPILASFMLAIRALFDAKTPELWTLQRLPE